MQVWRCVPKANTCELAPRDTADTPALCKFQTQPPCASLSSCSKQSKTTISLLFSWQVGGKDTTRTLCTVEVYNTQSNTWRPQCPMLTPRSSFGIAVLDRRVFAVGGLNSSDITISSVEYYDSATNLWFKEACPLLFGRASLSCCVVSGLPNIAEHVISRDLLKLVDCDIPLDFPEPVWRRPAKVCDRAKEGNGYL